MPKKVKALSSWKHLSNGVMKLMVRLLRNEVLDPETPRKSYSICLECCEKSIYCKSTSHTRAKIFTDGLSLDDDWTFGLTRFDQSHRLVPTCELVGDPFLEPLVHLGMDECMSLDLEAWNCYDRSTRITKILATDHFDGILLCAPPEEQLGRIMDKLESSKAGDAAGKEACRSTSNQMDIQDVLLQCLQSQATVNQTHDRKISELIGALEKQEQCLQSQATVNKTYDRKIGELSDRVHDVIGVLEKQATENHKYGRRIGAVEQDLDSLHQNLDNQGQYIGDLNRKTTAHQREIEFLSRTSIAQGGEVEQLRRKSILQDARLQKLEASQSKPFDPPLASISTLTTAAMTPSYSPSFSTLTGETLDSPEKASSAVKPPYASPSPFLIRRRPSRHCNSLPSVMEKENSPQNPYPCHPNITVRKKRRYFPDSPDSSDS